MNKKKLIFSIINLALCVICFVMVILNIVYNNSIFHYVTTGILVAYAVYYIIYSVWERKREKSNESSEKLDEFDNYETKQNENDKQDGK